MPYNPLDTQQLIAEIEGIQRDLDSFNDTSPFYLPPLLADLRKYIFQMHSEYEQTVQVLISRYYMKDSTNYGDAQFLFEQMSFHGKLKVITKYYPNFPVKMAAALNDIRNKFAHWDGERLRNEYDDNKRLKIYKRLQKSKDALSSFWEARRTSLPELQSLQQ